NKTNKIFFNNLKSIKSNYKKNHKSKNSFFSRGLLIHNHEYLVIRNISKKKKEKLYATCDSFYN
ncbi:hypothetical protein, partial [Klebsiella pneumoniae]|uniref:hypothetical protein n=1 Tax=Klebsiella pneumoniae TaxID=573 RepID=UPI002731BA03